MVYELCGSPTESTWLRKYVGNTCLQEIFTSLVYVLSQPKSTGTNSAWLEVKPRTHAERWFAFNSSLKLCISDQSTGVHKLKQAPGWNSDGFSRLSGRIMSNETCCVHDVSVNLTWLHALHLQQITQWTRQDHGLSMNVTRPYISIHTSIKLKNAVAVNNHMCNSNKWKFPMILTHNLTKRDGVLDCGLWIFPTQFPGHGRLLLIVGIPIFYNLWTIHVYVYV